MDHPSLVGPVAATGALAVPLVLLDLRMQRSGGTGIIPFELAGPERSQKILDAWGVEGRRAARGSLLLDFPYLVAYTTLNVRLTDRVTGSSEAAKRVVKAVQVAAGACDALENAALLGVVARSGDARLAGIARRAASVKFAALILGWLYGGSALLRRRHD